MSETVIVAERYHDFSCGHRVHGHESKCAFLHGHNYRVHFTCQANLDAVGRVLDFSAISRILCQWLEENWDHRFLAWSEDDVVYQLKRGLQARAEGSAPNAAEALSVFLESIVWVTFNPTAENMAQYLLEIIGPQELLKYAPGVRLVRVRIEETRKCSAEARLA